MKIYLIFSSLEIINGFIEVTFGYISIRKKKSLGSVGVAKTPKSLMLPWTQCQYFFQLGYSIYNNIINTLFIVWEKRKRMWANDYSKTLKKNSYHLTSPLHREQSGTEQVQSANQPIWANSVDKYHHKEIDSYQYESSSKSEVSNTYQNKNSSFFKFLLDI